MVETRTSLCRLCTAFCPIVVTVEDGRAVSVAGNTFRIGDANRVARIGEAVRQAYQAVMTLRGPVGGIGGELAC